MELLDAIKLLEMNEFSDVQDVKKCFHRLAHHFHPDKNPDERVLEKFRLILDAYEYCLRHQTELYRHFRKNDVGKESVKSFSTTVENTADIFEDIFGYSKSGRILGFQEHQAVYLTLQEFALGATRKQKLVAYGKCELCGGLGGKKDSIVRICRHCFGQGTVGKNTGGQGARALCPQCQGRGRMVMDPCVRCQGFGRLRQWHTQKLSLPVGMQPQQAYALESLDLVTGQPAQIFIEPRLLPDKVFQIEKFDLVCQYLLDFKKLNKDAEIFIQTPFDSVRAELPAGSRQGDLITVRGAGLYRDPQRQLRGDLRIRLAHKEPTLFCKLWHRLLQRLF